MSCPIGLLRAPKAGGDHWYWLHTVPSVTTSNKKGKTKQEEIASSDLIQPYYLVSSFWHTSHCRISQGYVAPKGTTSSVSFPTALVSLTTYRLQLFSVWLLRVVNHWTSHAALAKVVFAAAALQVISTVRVRENKPSAYDCVYWVYCENSIRSVFVAHLLDVITNKTNTNHINDSMTHMCNSITIDGTEWYLLSSGLWLGCIHICWINQGTSNGNGQYMVKLIRGTHLEASPGEPWWLQVFEGFELAYPIEMKHKFVFYCGKNNLSPKNTQIWTSNIILRDISRFH